MERRYILGVTLSTASILAGILVGNMYDNPLITGLGLAISILSFKNAEKISNLHGKTNEIKIINILTSNLVELIGAASTILFIQEALVSLALTGIVGFSLVFKSEARRKLSASIPGFLNRTERVLLLSVTFASGFLNDYLLLYGIVALAGLVTVDLLRTVYKLFFY